MAVFNDYINANIAAGTLTHALFAQGTSEIKMFSLAFDTVAADDAGSIYRVIKAIPSSAIIQRIEIWTDGVTGASAVDVGLYQTLADGGAVIDADILGADIDLSSAVLETAAKSGLVSVANSDRNKSLMELVGQTVTNRQMSYDLALTFNDITEADTVNVRVTYVV